MKPTPKQIRKKFAAMARKRAKDAKAKKRAIAKKSNPKKRRKNPDRIYATKGDVKKIVGDYATKRELDRYSRRIHAYDKAKAAGYIRKGSKAARLLKNRAATTLALLKASGGARRKALTKAAALRKEGYKIKKVHISDTALMAAAAAKAGKAAGKKVKNKSRKESKVAKKSKRKSKRGAKRKIKAARKSRKAARRSRKGRLIVLSRKGQKVTIKRKNPNMVAMIEQYSGFKVEEMGSLLVGGALYGTVDGLAAKYAPGVYAMAAKVPVVGTTVVPALIGAAMNFAGKKFNVKALSMVGEGLVGAAVVAMGIQASQYLPGIAHPAAAAVSGVDFTPGRGVLMGYPRDGADFGNVDFTPGPGVLMGGAPQLGMDAQLGEVPTGLSGYARDGADFGEIPEGLGGLA